MKRYSENKVLATSVDVSTDLETGQDNNWYE